MTGDLPQWLRYAACNGMDGDIFFPTQDVNGRPRTQPETAALLAQARQVCASCPVRIQCLERALRDREPEGGVWGGVLFSRKRLRALRRERLLREAAS